MKGRPSKYKEEYSVQARKLCLLGATDIDLADFFNVSEQTINAWKKTYPDFFESLKTSKEEMDEKVERSLFHRATGYSHPEDKIFNNNGEEMIVETTKHYPPDVAACIFWLKNRKKEDWQNSHKQVLPSYELDIPENSTPYEAAEIIIKSLSNKKIPADVAAMMMSSVKAMIDIEEYTILKERIESLEKAMNAE